MHLAQLNITSPSDRFTNYNTLPADLLSRILLFAIALAGFYFFIQLILAGYQYMTSLGNPERIQATSNQITNALLGLLIIICAYFIAQIIQSITGLNIL
jgi:TRAP-type C4-dicarboxylate transport system permease small subunit